MSWIERWDAFPASSSACSHRRVRSRRPVRRLRYVRWNWNDLRWENQAHSCGWFEDVHQNVPSKCAQSRRCKWHGSDGRRCCKSDQRTNKWRNLRWLSDPLVPEDRFRWKYGHKYGNVVVADNSEIVTLKLSSRIRCTREFKGWYASIRGILLVFSSVELLLVRARFETGFSFSQGHISECVHSSRVSQRKRPSLGLCLESLLGQSRCVGGVEAGCMGGSLCSGVDVMNRNGDSCVYQWLCSGWKCECGRQKCVDWNPGKEVQFQRLYVWIAERDENWRQRQCTPQAM